MTLAAHCQLKHTHSDLKGSAAQGPNWNRLSSNPHVLKQEKKSEEEREKEFLLATRDWCHLDLLWYEVVLFRLGFSAAGNFRAVSTEAKRKKQMKPAHDSPIENEGLKGLNGEEEMEDNRT